MKNSRSDRMNLAGIEWIPVSLAALILKVSRQRVYRLVEQEKLVSMRIESLILVSAASVHARNLSRSLSEVD